MSDGQRAPAAGSPSPAPGAPTPPGGGGGAGGAPFPLPPGFPPGVDPTTYRIDEVRALLEAAAYFPLRSVPRPGVPNEPIPGPAPGSTGGIVGVTLHERGDRFLLGGERSRGRIGLRGVNCLGDPAVSIDAEWRPIPEGFVAAPGRRPPPTPFEPGASQRFVMLDGELRFLEAGGDGFRGFGCGRTFPVPGGGGAVRLGAVIDARQGLGRLAGLPGTMVVNGVIRPPYELDLQVMVRMMDPERRLATPRPPRPPRERREPPPGATILAFLGETNPDKPVTLRRGPGGEIVGSEVHELLRLVELDFHAGPSGAEARSARGPVVGELDAVLHFDPLSPAPVGPVQTRQGVFRFHDRRGDTLGTIRADMVEGRALRTPLPGAPLPVFRFGGFGPVLEGDGELEGVQGMMSMNSAISVFPRTLSNLYLFRLDDPRGRLRGRCGRAWQGPGQGPGQS